MKRCYFTVLACFCLLACYSQTNHVILNHGKWNSNATWGLGHAPQNGEIAIIPADSTLVVDNNIQIATDITLKIYGELNFQVGKLKLTANSVVLLYPGGTISSQQGTPSDKIEIGGVSKYTGDAGTLTGPLMADISTTGFAFFPVFLPVKFIAFNVCVIKENNAFIKWSVAEESNAAKYIVERSKDGYNWQDISQIPAVYKSSVLNNYSYTDKEILRSIVYYRIRQEDLDGHFIYSNVKSIRPEASSPEIKVYTIAHNLVVEFSQQPKGNVIMQLVSLSGQSIIKQTYYQPAGYIILNRAFYKGHYILSVSTGQGIKFVKHIFID